MSIVFNPKVPKSFSFGSGKREVINPKPKPFNKPNPWSDLDIERLINLRSLNVPLKDCTMSINHSYTSCCEMANRKDILNKIQVKRDILIRQAIK